MSAKSKHYTPTRLVSIISSNLTRMEERAEHIAKSLRSGLVLYTAAAKYWDVGTTTVLAMAKTRNIQPKRVQIFNAIHNAMTLEEFVLATETLKIGAIGKRLHLFKMFFTAGLTFNQHQEILGMLENVYTIYKVMLSQNLINKELNEKS